MDFVTMLFWSVTYIFMGLCKNLPSSNYKKTGFKTRLFQPKLKMTHFQPKDPQCLLHNIYIRVQFKKTLVNIHHIKFLISDKISYVRCFTLPDATSFPASKEPYYSVSLYG